MDKADEIRLRKGYARWDEFQTTLSVCNTVEEVLLAIHNMVDAMNGYGSVKTSEMSKESLQQVIKDCRLVDYVVRYADTGPSADEGNDK